MTLSTDRREDLRLMLRAAADAGRAVLAAFRTDQEVRHKSPSQPVTDADLEADRRIGAVLRGERPGYGWLSEETVDRPDRLDRRRVWIVDPIDGTRSFVAGYAEFGISVGLAEAGEAVAGVVYNPATGELFWGVRGEGAYRVGDWDGSEDAALDAARLRIPDDGPGRGQDHRRPIMVASRSEIRRGEMEPFEAAWEILPLGSSAYKMMAVAAGRGQALVSRGPKHEWDLAGGVVVVEEAGGRVTDLRGDALRFNRPDPSIHGLLAAVPDHHAGLLEQVRGLPTPRLGRTPGGRAEEGDD